MKGLKVFLVLSVLLALPVRAADGEVKVEYDRFKDETTVSTRFQITNDTLRLLALRTDLAFAASYQGQKVTKPVEHVFLLFIPAIKGTWIQVVSATSGSLKNTSLGVL
jgi:hypothetical protein